MTTRNLLLLLLALLAEGCVSNGLKISRLGPAANTSPARIVSSPSQIDCGPVPSAAPNVCSGSFNDKITRVTLNAVPPGDVFEWMGCNPAVGNNQSCIVDMAPGRQVFASFVGAGPRPDAVLRVNLNAAGSFPITPVVDTPFLSSSTITARQTAYRVNAGRITRVSLRGDISFRILEWVGCDAQVLNKAYHDQLACIAAVGADRSVTARVQEEFLLRILPRNQDGDDLGLSGPWGSVSFSPEYRPSDCPGVCRLTSGGGPSYKVDAEKTITLKAAGVPGQSVFIGWSNAPSCSGAGDCVITMIGPLDVVPKFRTQFPLTVSRRGGSGVIKAGLLRDPQGNLTNPDIDCGARCSADFPPGRRVVVQAFPLPLSWGGACRDTVGATCFVDMGTSLEPIQVSARFPDDVALPGR